MISVQRYSHRTLHRHLAGYFHEHMTVAAEITQRDTREAMIDHRAEALRLYQQFVEKTPKHEYRTRIDELTTAAPYTTPETENGSA